MDEEEIWKDIDGYEQLYQVSNLGRVRSLERLVTTNKGNGGFKKIKSKIREPQNRNGYKVVALFRDGKRTSFYIHRLVAESFILNHSNFPMVNHKDEKRENNTVENLEWCNHQYNITYGTTLQRKSEALARAVQGTHVKTDEKITFSSTMEAGKNGFSQSAICRCCNNKMEKHKNYKWKYIQERGDHSGTIRHA